MSATFLPKTVIAGLFLLPLPALAAFSITEIMYDAPGADSGREWVEIQNTGPDSVDISGWKFFENGVNHKITPQSSSVIPAGGYAVIAANADKFLVDWPGYSGLLFHSSFSLGNTGESVVLKDGSSADVASAEYPTSGATGDGNSLNFIGSSWVPRKPSPGVVVSAAAIVPPPAPIKKSGNAAAVHEVSSTDGAADDGAVAIQGDMAASPATLPSGGGNQASGILPWVLGLVGVILIAGAAIFLGKKPDTGSGYTIIEEKT